MCPRCGEVLTPPVQLTPEALDAIRERSILRGQIAELSSRNQRLTSRISNLKSVTLLLLVLLPLSHWLCNKRPPQPTVSGLGHHLTAAFAQEQLRYHRLVIDELRREAPAFLYITTYGDYAGQLSQAFYGSTQYADTLLQDNTIGNDRRIPTGDTLVLRRLPQRPLPLVRDHRRQLIEALQQGDTTVLATLPEAQ